MGVCAAKDTTTKPGASQAPAPATTTTTGPLLPQHDTTDHRRARAADLDSVRTKYEYKYSPFPAHVAHVPLEEVPVKGLLELINVGMRLEYTQAADWWNKITNQCEAHAEKKKAAEGSPTANAFADYYLIFGDDRLPAIAKDNKWRTDEAFGEVHTDGLFVWFIEKCDLAKLKKKMAITNERVAAETGGKTLEELEAAGRLFVSDHEVLEGVPTKPGVHLYATITLFWVDESKKLMPLAIQLGQTPDAPLVTPDRAKPNAWLAAKIHVGSANLMVHSGYYHAFEMHFLMETFWASCCRNLADTHPLKAFLKPHAMNTIFVNDGVRGTLVPDGSLDQVFGSGAAGAVKIAENCWKKFSYVGNLDIKSLLERRQVSGIPKFTYRDDALDCWKIHHDYITGVVKTFYKSDADVVEDYELQAWVKDMQDPITCNLPGLPVDPTSKQMTTVDQLVLFILCSFFNAVFQHTFVENLGLLYWGFTPMNPAAFKLPAAELAVAAADITEQRIVECLPPVKMAILQNALSWSVNDVKPEECFLLGYYAKEFMEGAPPGLQQAIDKWRADMKAFDDKVMKRDALKAKPISWISIIH